MMATNGGGSVCPGFVDTDMNVPYYNLLGGREALEAGLADFQPIGRPIEPIEIAQAVTFLLSDLSTAVTGTAFMSTEVCFRRHDCSAQPAPREQGSCLWSTGLGPRLPWAGVDVSLNNRATREVTVSHEVLSPQIEQHVANLSIIRIAAEGQVTLEHLRRWLIAEYQCQNAEIAALCTMGARFVGDDRAVAFVIEVAGALASGREGLDQATGAAGLTRAEMDKAILPGVHEYTGLVSWLALHGEPAEVAAVVHDDWVLYCAACAELARVLADSGVADGPAPPQVLDYLHGYKTPPRQIIDAAATLVRATRAETGDLTCVNRSLPRVAPSLAAIWQSVAGHSNSSPPATAS